MAAKKAFFNRAQKAALRSAGNALIDAADTEFRRGMRKVASAAGGLAKSGIRGLSKRG